VELKKLHQIASQLGLGLDNHLAEGYVVSPRAAFSRVWEKSSIPQHSIYPRDTILSTPFSDVIFPPEGVLPYEDEASRAAAGGRQALCSESASHSGGGCRGMGSGGCVRSKGGASGQLVATGKGVEVGDGSSYRVFFSMDGECKRQPPTI
jgi:hypothetical protein